MANGGGIESSVKNRPESSEMIARRYSTVYFGGSPQVGIVTIRPAFARVGPFRSPTL